MAQKWSVPPWEIAGGTPLIWYLRQKVFDDLIADAKKKKKH